MPEGLVNQTIDIPSGDLHVLQPEDAAELPDVGDVEWAPVVPYWSVLWRSSIALARELDAAALGDMRVVELGCGLAAPSIVAARGGATVLATDDASDALALAERNAQANGVEIETAAIDWTRPDDLVERGPFDLVLASDLLYERSNVGPLLVLLPRLAPEVWLAEPGRPAVGAFLDQAGSRWSIETVKRDIVRIHRLRLRNAR